MTFVVSAGRVSRRPANTYSVYWILFIMKYICERRETMNERMNDVDLHVIRTVQGTSTMIIRHFITPIICRLLSATIVLSFDSAAWHHRRLTLRHGIIACALRRWDNDGTVQITRCERTTRAQSLTLPAERSSPQVVVRLSCCSTSPEQRKTSRSHSAHHGPQPQLIEAAHPCAHTPTRTSSPIPFTEVLENDGHPAIVPSSYVPCIKMAKDNRELLQLSSCLCATCLSRFQRQPDSFRGVDRSVSC
jgi:hypothetical protein